MLPLVEGRYISSNHLHESLFFPHLLYQFVADSIDLGLDALVALSSVLVVKGKVETQQVVQGAVVRDYFSILCKIMLECCLSSV